MSPDINSIGSHTARNSSHGFPWFPRGGKDSTDPARRLSITDKSIASATNRPDEPFRRLHPRTFWNAFGFDPNGQHPEMVSRLLEGLAHNLDSRMPLAQVFAGKLAWRNVHPGVTEPQGLLVADRRNRSVKPGDIDGEFPQSFKE